jgi:TRAP-type C4-dicarboxylate transport system substrate-binding protein
MLQKNILILTSILLFSITSAHALTFRAGSVLPPNSDQGIAADYFAKRVNELTNGSVTVKIFHSGELGPPPTQFENTITGAQDMVIDTLDYFKSYDDRFGVMNTPFVFRSREHTSKYLNSNKFKKMSDAIEERGLVFIGNYNWMRQQDRGILSRTPILTPDDLQGYKMRMYQAEMPIQFWSGMGANLSVLSWADVYTALATGTVDSLTTVVSASYLNKHIEAVKYFTNLREYFQIVLPVVSKKSWDKLNSKQKNLFHQAANEAGEVYVKMSKQKNDEHIEAAKEELGLVYIEPPLGPWHKHADGVHEMLENKGFIPRGIIAEARAIK